MSLLSRPVTTCASAVAALATIMLAACDDRVSVEPPRPVPPPVPANAWIVLSDSGARAGSEISISAFATIPEGGAIGSFSARLLYDTLQLRVGLPDELPDGAVRAVNPIEGAHRIAGASARGLGNGLLFRVRARVIDPRGLRRIALAIDELHSTRFAELTSALQVTDGRAELLSGMKHVQTSARSRQP
ncbi:MAG: hypothetical protein ACT4P7_13965 [Gemmatimonadaceae bacterium]